jgi:4-amino-4-deoxy-L-arabinose transferase-like glycosyltransferase
LLLPGCVVMLARYWRVVSPLVIVSLGWVTVVLAVFLVGISPRAVYFLPAYPALALLGAWGWQSAEGSRRRWLALPLGIGVVISLVIAIIIAVRPVVLRFHDDPVRVPASVGLLISVALLLAGVAALGLARRGRPGATLAVVAGGVVATLLVVDIGARTPFYNALYPIQATVRRLEERIPPGAEVGYTESKRTTALAASLARPLRQLPVTAITERPGPPAPAYLILPDFEFQAACQPWSLERVDEVVFRRERYVLGAVGSGPGRSPC